MTRTLKPEEPWIQLGITEEQWHKREAKAQAAAEGRPLEIGIADLGGDIDLIDGQDDAAHRSNSLQANAHAVLVASPTLNPLAAPLPRKRKPKAVKPTVRTATPYYVNLPGVRYDVSTDEGHCALQSWLESSNYDLVILSLVNTLVIDVLKARSKS